MRQHYLLSNTKQYGRYKMLMTQHVYVEDERKRFADVHWVILIDEQHIVLNIHLDEKTQPKITEETMDQYWNKFLIDYNEMLDVWENRKIQDNPFNTFKYKAPKQKITRTEFDALSQDLNLLERQLKLVTDKIKEYNKKI